MSDFISLPHWKEAAQHARDLGIDAQALAGPLKMYDITEDAPAKFEILAMEIESKHGYEPYVALMHFPGKREIFVKSIRQVGLGGEPFVPCYIDGYAVWKAEQEADLARRMRELKLEKARVEQLRVKREEERRNAELRERLDKIGLRPEDVEYLKQRRAQE